MHGVRAFKRAGFRVVGGDVLQSLAHDPDWRRSASTGCPLFADSPPFVQRSDMQTSGLGESIGTFERARARRRRYFHKHFFRHQPGTCISPTPTRRKSMPSAGKIAEWSADSSIDQAEEAYLLASARVFAAEQGGEHRRHLLCAPEGAFPEGRSTVHRARLRSRSQDNRKEQHLPTGGRSGGRGVTVRRRPVPRPTLQQSVITADITICRIARPGRTATPARAQQRTDDKMDRKSRIFAVPPTPRRPSNSLVCRRKGALYTRPLRDHRRHWAQGHHDGPQTTRDR